TIPRRGTSRIADLFSRPDTCPLPPPPAAVPSPVASAPGGQSAAPGGAAEHGRRRPHTAASGGGTFLLSLTLQEDKVHKGETPRELWPRPQPSRGSRCRLPGKAGPRRGDSSPEPKPLRRATGVPPDHEAEK